MMRSLALLVSCALLAGCGTMFFGSSKIPNGVTGCKAVCSQWGMELSGMIAMGEYSDGCICQVPGKPQALTNGAAAGVAAAVGVMLQAERQRQQAFQAGTMHPGMHH